jgi:hypothetical protein
VQGIGERKATNPSLARDRRERDRWRGYEGEREESEEIKRGETRKAKATRQREGKRLARERVGPSFLHAKYTMYSHH